MTDLTTAVQALRETLGTTRVFGAAFTKKDGTLREGSFRLGVTKDQTGEGLSYDSNAAGNLIVWDMSAGGYRTIRLGAIRRLTVDGVNLFNVED